MRVPLSFVIYYIDNRVSSDSAPLIDPNLFHPDPANIEGNAESARVIGLMPWMDYEFQVIASNILGSGEPSMPSHTIRTQQAGDARTHCPVCLG